jgi:hypothetical protein
MLGLGHQTLRKPVVENATISIGSSFIEQVIKRPKAEMLTG